MGTNSTFQLREQLAADVDSASSSDQLRFFMNSSNGLLCAKDVNGNVTVIGGTQTIAWVHNAVITSADSPYSPGYHETVKADPTTGTIIITLPTAVGKAGQQIQVISKYPLPGPPPNSITVNTVLAQTINGQTTFAITTSEESLLVESDGTNWLIL